MIVLRLLHALSLALGRDQKGRPKSGIHDVSSPVLDLESFLGGTKKLDFLSINRRAKPGNNLSGGSVSGRAVRKVIRGVNSYRENA